MSYQGNGTEGYPAEAFASAAATTSVTLAASYSSAAATSASTAATHAATALSHATTSAINAGATLWVSGTTYAIGDARYSAVTGQTYRRLTAGAGTIDPSTDTTNWKPILLDVQTNLPTIRPSLNLDFANIQIVDPRITFTRASTATRVNKKGLIESVASGVPRIDYDPITLACKGLLIEESRTSLLTYSQEFDNAAWSKVNGTVTANASVAPDGTTTMDKWVVDNGLSSISAYIGRSFSKAASATTYSLSFFVKAAEVGGFRIYVRDAATSANFAIVTFNVNSGTIQTAAAAGGTFTAASAPVPENYGGGIYRCSLKFTTGTETSISIRPLVLNEDGTSFIGDGTSGLFVWGAQLEAGPFPTSYIPTTSAQVTRAADVASMTGSNFSSWYRQDEGTFTVSCIPYATSYATAGHIVSVSAGITAEFLLIQRVAALTSGFAITTASVAQMANNGTIMATGETSNLALAYKLNDSVGAYDGVLTAVDAACTMPAVTQMHIGSRYDSVRFISGHIKQLTYYPERLQSETLTVITSQ
jgi:hypothetical protein